MTTATNPKLERIALIALRVLPALMMFIHGVYRVADGGVNGFGGYLGSVGLPAGPLVAWTLAIVEIAGGAAMMSGRFVLPLCLWFMAEHTMGMLLVHRPHGWFVVVGGRNGMEYSSVLFCLFAINALLARARKPPAGELA